MGRRREERMAVGWVTLLLWLLVTLFLSSPCHGLSAASRAKRRQRGLVQTGNLLNTRGTNNDKKVLVQENDHPSLLSSSSSVVSLETTVDDDDDDSYEKERWWNMAGQTSRRKRQRGRQPSQNLREDSFVVTLANPSTTNSNNNHNNKKQSSFIRDAMVAPEESTIVDIDIIFPSTQTDNDGNGQVTPILADIALVNGTILRGVDPTTLHQRYDHAIWMALRKAMNVTASELSAIVGHSVFTTREKLLNAKSGILSSSSSSSIPMNRQACEWGLKMEPKALKQYCEVTGNQVHETGLHIRQFHPEQGDAGPVLLVGASPDGLVIDAKDQSRGVLEIKSLWGRRNKKELPQFKHCPQRFYDQIQGQLAVCDMEWCDLIMYIPPNSPRQQRGGSAPKNYCILRIQRDRVYWKETLFPAIQSFCRELEEIRTTDRRMTNMVDPIDNIGIDIPTHDSIDDE